MIEIKIICKQCQKPYTYMSESPSYKKVICHQCRIYNRKMAGKLFRDKYPASKPVGRPRLDKTKVKYTMVWDESNEIGY
jgi:hypothetical protein